MWMLFPTEDEYTEWFTKAGFTDVEITRIGPKWYNGERKWGLIMGCSVTGVKPKVGTSGGWAWGADVGAVCSHVHFRPVCTPSKNLVFLPLLYSVCTSTSRPVCTPVSV